MRLDFAGSLRLKLTGVILLTTLAALVIALVAIAAYDLRTYHRTLAEDVTTQAELLGRSLEPALAFDDTQAASEALGLLELRPAVQAAAVYTPRGALFASYARPGVRAAFPRLPGPEGVHVAGDDLVLFKRIASDREIVGTVYLRTDYALARRIADYLAITVVVAIASMLAALLVTSRLQQRVTRPILDVAGIAREVVAGKDYSRRAVRTSEDEVGVLVGAFNDMLDEIERRTADLEAANAELGREVVERARVEEEVLRLNAELEDRVRQRTAQLEDANRELEAFSFSVSHDLRAPLRHIGGYAHMLKEDAGELDVELRRYVDGIGDSARRMGALIDDLLAFSRLGRNPISRVEVDMNLVAERALREARDGRAGSATVALGELPPAFADPQLLHQVWVNLLSNALKYSATRGIEARVDVSGETDGRVSRYTVRDNGVGFDMKYAGKLFGVFQRLHSQDEFEGTGVGLAIVQRIVHRHGGRVWADARPGRGAAFTIELPTIAATALETVA